MRVSSFQYPRFLTAWLVACVLACASAADAEPPFFDSPSGPKPLKLPGNPHPIQHTAQDDGGSDPPYEEDHTAQDDGNPSDDGSGDDEKSGGGERDSENRYSPRPRLGDSPMDFEAIPSIDAPLVDLLDTSDLNAPDAREYLVIEFGDDDVTFGSDVLGTDDVVVTRISSGAVPTPGALVVIGLGALALRRRRRL